MIEKGSGLLGFGGDNAYYTDLFYLVRDFMCDYAQFSPL